MVGRSVEVIWLYLGVHVSGGTILDEVIFQVKMGWDLGMGTKKKKDHKVMKGAQENCEILRTLDEFSVQSKSFLCSG